jgi:hypothetical protein
MMASKCWLIPEKSKQPCQLFVSIAVECGRWIDAVRAQTRNTCGKSTSFQRCSSGNDCGGRGRGRYGLHNDGRSLGAVRLDAFDLRTHRSVTGGDIALLTKAELTSKSFRLISPRSNRPHGDVALHDCQTSQTKQLRVT